ncbi:MAG: Asp-tRNA(Asn)/Glu-tRNA(Gln) amidotransferase GatCAB subunit B, partial [Cyclobacteriaceae bacterium]|nr:Asp-tRNA(Asn)/Glu-tRNA(Gln) amidotransferase GatCAB subunit B [Cyclobacteriaceae bacterium]
WEVQLPVKSLAKAISWVEEGKMSDTQGTRKLLPALLDNYQLDIEQFAELNHLFLSTNTNELKEAVSVVLNDHMFEVEKYKKGKKGLMQLFIGKVMAATKGKADPKQVVAELQEELNK